MSTLNREKPLDPSLLRFDLEKPSILKWIIILTIGIALNFYWVIIAGLRNGLIVTAIVVIFSAIVWNKIGFRIVSKTIMRKFDYFNTLHGRNKELKKSDINVSSGPIFRFIGSIILKLLGFSLSKENEYYIEAEVNDISISKVSDIFRLRLIDVISSCLGISMIIGVITRYLIRNYTSWSYNPNLFHNFLFYLVVISPILVFWLVPVLWIFEDAQIRTIKDDGLDSDELINNIRNGLLGKLLDYGGIIFGISILMNFSPEEYADSFIDQLFWSLISLLFFVFALGGTVYLTTAVYLTLFHEKNVNKFRIFISNFVPIGVTVIKVEQPYKPSIGKQVQTLPASHIVCNCGYNNPVSSKYCKKCGTSVQKPSINRFCIKCGASRKYGVQKYCKNCGGKY